MLVIDAPGHPLPAARLAMVRGSCVYGPPRSPPHRSASEPSVRWRCLHADSATGQLSYSPLISAVCGCASANLARPDRGHARGRTHLGEARLVLTRLSHGRFGLRRKRTSLKTMPLLRRCLPAKPHGWLLNRPGAAPRLRRQAARRGRPWRFPTAGGTSPAPPSGCRSPRPGWRRGERRPDRRG